jgi:macrolide transport system ATP-binding/permease protein
VFQGYHLIPFGSAQENVEMPAIYAGLPRQPTATPAPPPCSNASALASNAPATARTNCPAASSNGYQSPER